MLALCSSKVFLGQCAWCAAHHPGDRTEVAAIECSMHSQTRCYRFRKGMLSTEIVGRISFLWKEWDGYGRCARPALMGLSLPFDAVAASNPHLAICAVSHNLTARPAARKRSPASHLAYLISIATFRSASWASCCSPWTTAQLSRPRPSWRPRTPGAARCCQAPLQRACNAGQLALKLTNEPSTLTRTYCISAL
jgi:hypothetical protein